ncbi:MAG: metalloregulator ArsR/SmtB family transcription factor [Longimicrobiales bacterium]|nr:metalloregulator ArsR/SmtB family transcription factor [Longimicrobiales bacterium]
MVRLNTAPAPTAVLGVFRALADENRLRIIEVLREGERCVCDIQSSLDLGQSLLSHHLGVLREAGLVRARREGRWVHYALSDEVLSMAEAWLAETREASALAYPRRSRC